MSATAVWRWAASGVLLVMTSGLSGCLFGGNKDQVICDEPREYQQSESTAPLTVPTGLDEPEREERLEIPGDESETEYPDGRPCLERPPDFFGR